MKSIAITLFISLSCFHSYSQAEKFVKIVSRYEISCDEETQKLQLRICFPQDVKYKQAIGAISFSVEPERVYYENGKRYAEFILEEPYKTKKIDMVVAAKIYQCDYNTLSKKKLLVTGQDTVLQKFLVAERSIETDNFHIQKKLQN